MTSLKSLKTCLRYHPKDYENKELPPINKGGNSNT